VAANSPKSENLLLNLACNLVVPTLVLTKLSDAQRLGPVWALVAGLAFPLGYGVWDYARRRQANLFSILGFVSVLLSGGLGLMKVGPTGLAVKEAAIPALIGVCVLLSARGRRPLVREVLFNPQVVDVARVEAALAAQGREADFSRLLGGTTHLLAGTFFMSAGINWALARYFLQSPAGTPELTAEMGRMLFWSWPAITLPCMAAMAFALWRLVQGVKRLTGLTLEEILRVEPERKKHDGAQG
jgi:hypothetical protein